MRQTNFGESILIKNKYILFLHILQLPFGQSEKLKTNIGSHTWACICVFVHIYIYVCACVLAPLWQCAYTMPWSTNRGVQFQLSFLIFYLFEARCLCNQPQCLSKGLTHNILRMLFVSVSEISDMGYHAMFLICVCVLGSYNSITHPYTSASLQLSHFSWPLSSSILLWVLVSSPITPSGSSVHAPPLRDSLLS